MTSTLCLAGAAAHCLHVNRSGDSTSVSTGLLSRPSPPPVINCRCQQPDFRREKGHKTPRSEQLIIIRHQTAVCSEAAPARISGGDPNSRLCGGNSRYEFWIHLFWETRLFNTGLRNSSVMGNRLTHDLARPFKVSEQQQAEAELGWIRSAVKTTISAVKYKICDSFKASKAARYYVLSEPSNKQVEAWCSCAALYRLPHEKHPDCHRAPHAPPSPLLPPLLPVLPGRVTVSAEECGPEL